jgi:hypothetical protein
MRLLRLLCRFALPALVACAGTAQVIEFQSGGLSYQTLTKGGVTIMFAHMPVQVRDYAIIQVAVSNGSSSPCTVRPEDFRFEINNGAVILGADALSVVNELTRHASGDDVIKLVTTYEMGLYGMGRIRSTNGYEKRRQAALAVVSSRRLKAAAAASAIAFVESELSPGESTDGAVFYPVRGKHAEETTLKVTAAGDVFEFEPSMPSWGRPQ